jgi:multidrug efflux system outer membrane protein
MGSQVWRAGLWSGICAAAGLTAACAVGPNYHPPKTELPPQFSEVESTTRPTTHSSTQPIAADEQPDDYQRWWTTLNDAELNSLIDRAMRNNLDLVAAEARIREARSQRSVTASGLYPEVDATGSYTRSKLSANAIPGAGGQQGGFIPGVATTLWQAGFDATWEVDVFGGTRRGIEAGDYAIAAAQEDRRDVLVSLLAEVAVNYIQLRGGQRELAIAEHNLDSQQQTLALTRSKAEGGVIPFLDVAQQEAQVATTAAAIPTLEAQIRQNIHHLGILLGQDPGALSAELTQPKAIPVGPPSVPPGIPSDLIRRRPDVRRAERQLAEATAQIGVATADLFPKFSITGALGTEGTQFKQLFDYSSRFYEIAPGVTWDIFDAGKVRSNIAVQNAREAEALAAYRKAVLQSLQDVDDALVNFNREQQRLTYLREAVDANQRSVDLSTELFEKGSTDFLSVLDAQRSLFAAQDAMAQSEQSVSSDLVALYKALGGGWQ